MHRLFGCGCLAVALTACASIETDVSSVRSPDFAGRRFSVLCVSAPDPDLRLRTATEDALAAALESRGVEASRLNTLLFPGKNHTEEEIAAKVRESGALGFLVLKPVSTWTEEQWIPGTITTHSHWGANRRPWGWGYGTTWVSGGYTVTRPRATIDARLFDVASEEIAWMASIGVSGSGGSSWADLRRAAAEVAVTRLAEDGMLEEILPRDPEP